MKNPEEMTDEELLLPRTIVSQVMLDDRSYDVMLSCGHGAQFVVKPALFHSPCAQCIDVFLERRKRKGPAK